MSEPSIICPRCHLVSHHKLDIREGWCGACKDYTGAFHELDERTPYLGSRLLHYDRQANAVSFGRWAWLIEHKFTDDYYKVKQETVDLYEVSTVWIGLDMSFGLGPPLIFETMTFLAGGSVDCWRWPTEAAALAGHQDIVAEIKAKIIAESENES